jgi:hypothetical protein
MREALMRGCSLLFHLYELSSIVKAVPRVSLELSVAPVTTTDFCAAHFWSIVLTIPEAKGNTSILTGLGFATEQELDGQTNEVMKLYRCAYLDFSAGNLAVLVVSVDLAGALNLMKYAGAWLVVAKHVKRIFAEMETAGAGFGLAFVRIGLALFELEVPALHAQVEAFETWYDGQCFLWCCFLCCHLISFLR